MHYFWPCARGSVIRVVGIVRQGADDDGHGGGLRLLEDEPEDHERDVEAGNGRDEGAQRLEHRVDDGREEALDLLDDLVALVEDAEREEPAHDGVDAQGRLVQVQARADEAQRRHNELLPALGDAGFRQSDKRQEAHRGHGCGRWDGWCRRWRRRGCMAQVCRTARGAAARRRHEGGSHLQQEHERRGRQHRQDKSTPSASRPGQREARHGEELVWQ
mmetsp:Transcript_27461/g.55479  ORF Transcript_27461/g.55479 Transcript_27461/m.55479 type:complete len:217 (+) Transcript_27461:101-751(+)